MSQNKRVVITYADDIGRELRQRFEQALAALEVACVGSEETDEADTTHLVPLYIASETTEHFSTPEHPSAVRVLIAEGSVPVSRSWIALRPDDIDSGSTAWQGFITTLGSRLDRPGLAEFAKAGGDTESQSAWSDRFPLDPLSETLRADETPAALRSRVTALEQELAEARKTASERDNARKSAEHDAQMARKKAVAAQNELQRTRLQVEALRLHLEESAWSPETLQGDVRKLVESARQSVWRARAAAAAGEQAEADGIDARNWPDTCVQYTGETQNGRPHGVGVMRFGADADDPTYRGEFKDGLRHGFGMGADADGLIWIGQWNNDQAEGFGALEFPNGERWEGKVKPQTGEAPAYRNLHVWSEKPGKRPRPVVHTEARMQIEDLSASPQPSN